MIGQVVGNYKIVEKIGEGGMGAVYKGLDVMLEREVAVKVLRPELARDPLVVDRFRSEAVTLARINHPNVATLYSFFRQEAEFFMVMEFVYGEPLDRLLQRSGALPYERVIPLFCQALDGIEHAHRLGIVHRDIKPANMILTRTGSIKVMDFGIARVLGSARRTRTGHLIGTMEYMSPEQMRGQETDARSDIYALGILLYEMLTGHVPFESGSDYELMRAQVEDAPRPPRTLTPAIPAAVEEVILRALDKQPENRFPTALSFRNALRKCLPKDEPATGSFAFPPATRVAEVDPGYKPTRVATGENAPAPKRRPLRLRPAHFAGLAAALVLAFLGLLFVPGSSPDLPEAPDPKPSVAVEDALPSQPAAGPAPAFQPRGGPGLPAGPAVGPAGIATTPQAPGAQPGTPAPESIAGWLERARALYAENKLTTPTGENALAYCRRILSREPGHAGATRLVEQIAQRYTAWGDGQMQKKAYAQALRLYDQSLAVRPDDPDVLRKRAGAEQALQTAQAASQETPAPAPPPERTKTPARGTLTLASGTEVRVRLLQTLRSEDGHRPGAPVSFEVVDEVRIDGRLVIPRNARAGGLIEEATAGQLFRKGEIRFIISFAEAVDGSRIPLRSASFGASGGQGKNAVVEKGYVYLARVAGNAEVSVR